MMGKDYYLLVKKLDTYGWHWSAVNDTEKLLGMLNCGWKLLYRGSRQEVVLDAIDRNFNYHKQLRDSKAKIH